MRHLRPPQRVAPGDPHRLPARPIEIGRRPARRVGRDAHPLGPKQVELARPVMPVGDQLHIGIAVQQQRRRDPLEQPVRANQLRAAPGLAKQRQPADRSGHQPHRAQPDRVPPINLVELRLIAASKPARLALALQPNRHKRPHRLRSLPRRTIQPIRSSSKNRLSRSWDPWDRTQLARAMGG